MNIFPLIGAWGLLGLCLSAGIVSLVRNSFGMGLIFTLSTLAIGLSVNANCLGEFPALIIMGIIATPLLNYAVGYVDRFVIRAQSTIKKLCMKNKKAIRLPE